jgi:glutathione S-transferase
MPTLAPARPFPDVAAESDLPIGSFFGRSFADYLRFFALDPLAWRGRDVLDVAAGPSSFTAEAAIRRIDAVAVDPLYDEPAARLADRAAHDTARMFEQMRTQRRRFRGKAFASFDEAEEDRRAAVRRFLADYETHFAHGRYVAGALPLLPFFDRTFDLVLCAHLLFLNAQRFDFDWHLDACRELVRVSAGEARIHPLCGADGQPYPGLARLRRELRASGIVSEVVELDGEFFAGADAMLVLRRADS